MCTRCRQKQGTPILVINNFTNPFCPRYLSRTQSETLPHILAAQDMICHAPTGTGKTLAYVLPLLHLLLEGYVPFTHLSDANVPPVRHSTPS